MGNLKHVVLIHGYSLAEHPELGVVTNKEGKVITGKFGDWEHVCIGSDTSHGRISRALTLASRLDAEQLIFSTGATWIGGKSEARYMYQVAATLLSYNTCKRTHDYPWLRNIAVFDEKSINTLSTMEHVAGILDTSSPVMLHHVTSANHAPRVMRDAIKVFGKMPNVLLSVVPADTSYGNKTPDDVVIYELGEPKKLA